MRRGISLLEVLFSIFVLSVALLCLASMVPVGAHQVQQARHADMGAACGKAAMNEFKVRDMGDPEFWVKRDGTQPATVSTFMLDPLSVATNNASSYDSFPYGTSVAFPRMPRLTLRRETPTGWANLTQAMAERIFSWTDDRVFETPTDEAARPRHLVDPTTGTVLPMWQQSHGDYTWMAMVTIPEKDTTVADSREARAQYGLATVSIVVSHKRELALDSAASAASERTVFCDMAGGGDVTLRDTSATSIQQADDILHVRPYQWILLAGQKNAHSSATNTALVIDTYKWYRVVTTSEMRSVASPYDVDVTLAGPDWNPSNFRDVDSDSTNGQTMYAVIMDGVIGVYEKVIQLDEPSVWTTH